MARHDRALDRRPVVLRGRPILVPPLRLEPWSFQQPSIDQRSGPCGGSVDFYLVQVFDWHEAMLLDPIKEAAGDRVAERPKLSAILAAIRGLPTYGKRTEPLLFDAHYTSLELTEAYAAAQASWTSCWAECRNEAQLNNTTFDHQSRLTALCSARCDHGDI